MIYTPPPRFRLSNITIMPTGDEMGGATGGITGAGVSGTWSNANTAVLYPIYLIEPFIVAKAFWANGSTVGTDSIDMGVYLMTDIVTGRIDLIRSTGPVLSANADVVQASGTWKVAANAAAITSGNDSTDSTTYTTASVTLKAARLYLLSFANTAASAAAPSGIAGGGTWTSRSSTQFNGTAHRNSIWSCVPTVDYVGTIVITFGATQTACTWGLNEFSGVNTTTNDGIVQQAVGTGTSVTPLATLAAFGSANNATFGALGNVSDTTTTPGTNFTELSDTNAATPTVCLQTQWRIDNDTTVDGTITSAAWGACAVELKASTDAFIIPPSLPGNPNVYMAMNMSGVTATIRRIVTNAVDGSSAGFVQVVSAFPLPSTATAVVPTTTRMPVAGFSLRTLID